VVETLENNDILYDFRVFIYYYDTIIVTKIKGFFMIKKLSVMFMLSIGLVSTATANKNIVVDLSTQQAMAMENGRVVFSGNISTGTPNRATPTGHFRVLEKDINHVSSSWPKPNGGAKMHYMLRVTGYGIAMHLGYVPNYPASHGCIRLENGFAQKMYSWARVGTPIRIKGHAPRRVDRSRRATRRVVSNGRKLTALERISMSPKIAAKAAKAVKVKPTNKKKKIARINPLEAISGR